MKYRIFHDKTLQADIPDNCQYLDFLIDKKLGNGQLTSPSQSVFSPTSYQVILYDFVQSINKRQVRGQLVLTFQNYFDVNTCAQCFYNSM